MHNTANGFDLDEYIESKNKSFDDRNEEKKEVHHTGKLKLVKVGQIWLCKIGMNIGGEISKGYDCDFQRPVLVISTFIGGDLVGVIPCSTQPAKNVSLEKFVISFDEREAYGLDKPTNFIINQFKIISIKRLRRLVNDISKEDKYIPLLSKDKITVLLNLLSEKILKIKKTS